MLALKNIEERLRANEETLTELKRENEGKYRSVIVFYIYISSVLFDPFSPSQNTLFCTVNLCTFTAPVNGIYFFIFYAHSSNQMVVSLHKNNQIQCSVFFLNPQTNANGSNGIVLSLQKGDEVYTQLWENSWVFDDENSFTGFLLFPCECL
uniref:Cerebellin 13 n=1 Tax=Cyprinus carpio TaxID=7962 RepID=A0A8C2CT98_CYPCA